MSEEESFVILGSSPTPSMEQYHEDHKEINVGGMIINELTNSEIDATTSINTMTQSDVGGYSLLKGCVSGSKDSILQTPISLAEQEAQQKISITTKSLPQNSLEIKSRTNTADKNDYNNGSIMNQKSSFHKLSGDNQSLAESFLMGNIDVDNLKSNVFGQFPSLNSGETKMEDVVKLQHFLCEHIELKDNLRKTNLAMRHHFAMINQWQNDIKNSKDAHAIEIDQYKQTIVKLNNQIYELERDTKLKLDDYNMTLKMTMDKNSRLEYEIRTLKSLYNKEMGVHQQMLPILNNKISVLEKDAKKNLKEFKMALTCAVEQNKEFAMTTSTKDAKIQNLSYEIEQLENRLESFQTMSNCNQENENISIEIHNEVVKDLQKKLGFALAENVKIQDVIKQSNDKIVVLQNKLKSTEQQLQRMQEIPSLDDNKDEHFEEKLHEKEEQISKLNEDVLLLKAQLEVYRHDFQMERNSREEIASEKEQILCDLKLLQRRNQQLIEETQESRQSLDPKTAIAGGSRATASSNNININNKNSKRMGGMSPTSSASSNNNSENIHGIKLEKNFMCPCCSAVYKNVTALEHHVQDCLDGRCFESGTLLNS